MTARTKAAQAGRGAARAARNQPGQVVVPRRSPVIDVLDRVRAGEVNELVGRAAIQVLTDESMDLSPEQRKRIAELIIGGVAGIGKVAGRAAGKAAGGMMTGQQTERMRQLQQPTPTQPSFFGRLGGMADKIGQSVGNMVRPPTPGAAMRRAQPAGPRPSMPQAQAAAPPMPKVQPQGGMQNIPAYYRELQNVQGQINNMNRR